MGKKLDALIAKIRKADPKLKLINTKDIPSICVGEPVLSRDWAVFGEHLDRLKDGKFIKAKASSLTDYDGKCLTDEDREFMEDGGEDDDLLEWDFLDPKGDYLLLIPEQQIPK